MASTPPRELTDSYASIRTSAEAEQVSLPAADDRLPAIAIETLSRVVRKLDLILLPFLCLLFLLNSLDKSNVGNAETGGFTKDTGLDSDDLNTSMAFFFAFFVTLQPLSAGVGRWVGMSRWVPSCMVLWGMCTILHVFVRSRTQLILLRIAIAILESGFYPTTVHYLSLFYTRSEFAFRLGFFYGQSTMAGAVGALLSWMVFSIYPEGKMAGNLHAWQLLFVVEGCLTVTVASLGFFWLPRSVNTSWFLEKQERQIAETRVELDRGLNMLKPPLADSDDEDDIHDRLLRASTSTLEQKDIISSTAVTMEDIRSAFLQRKVWHLLICNVLSAIPATAFAIFLPIVIRELSPTELTPAHTNLLAAPPFLCGALSVLIFTRWSDNVNKRLLPILCGVALLCTGLLSAVLLPDSMPFLRYLSICLIFSGSYIASPLTVAWITDNTPELGKRAVMLGMNGWGNIAGVTSGFLFTKQDARNGYPLSFTVTLVCALLSLCGYALFLWLLYLENLWRQGVLRRWTPAEVKLELRYGDGPLDDTEFWTWRVFHRPRTSIRKGDDCITYQYTT